MTERVNIIEAFRRMRENPGQRWRPVSWQTSWFEYGECEFSGTPDWKVMHETSQGLTEHPIFLWFRGALALEEWERVESLCEVKETVYFTPCHPAFPLFAVAERVGSAGKRFRIYAHLPLAASLRVLLPEQVYDPGYACDRWEDTEAEAIIGSEVWSSMSREEQDTVRRHHSKVTVVIVQQKEETA